MHRREMKALGMALLVMGVQLAMGAQHAHADEMVFYRCTDAAGMQTVQNQPCPAGSEQTRRVVTTPPPRSTAPPPTPDIPQDPRRPSADAIRALQEMQGQSGIISGDGGILDSAAPRAVEEDAGLLDSRAIVHVDPAKPPLPPIFRCTRGDGSQYTHEYTEAPPVCEALQTRQLGGQGEPVGVACEVRRDVCEQISEERACVAWQQRLRDARGSARFARDAQKVERDAEVPRLQGVIGESGCPLP